MNKLEYKSLFVEESYLSPSDSHLEEITPFHPAFFFVKEVKKPQLVRLVKGFQNLFILFRPDSFLKDRKSVMGRGFTGGGSTKVAQRSVESQFSSEMSLSWPLIITYS